MDVYCVKYGLGDSRLKEDPPYIWVITGRSNNLWVFDYKQVIL